MTLQLHLPASLLDQYPGRKNSFLFVSHIIIVFHLLRFSCEIDMSHPFRPKIYSRIIILLRSWSLRVPFVLHEACCLINQSCEFEVFEVCSAFSFLLVAKKFPFTFIAEAQTPADFFPFVQALMNKITPCLCWWE